MKTIKRRAFIMSAPIAGIVFAACGPNQTAEPRPAGTSAPSTGSTGSTGSTQSATTAPSGAAGRPVRGGTITIAMPRDAVTFDPIRQNDSYSAVVLNMVVDTLYEIDSKNNVVGRLVEKTENPQPNVYIMTLRKGIKFQDGSDLTADAVKFNLERHMTAANSVRSQDVREIQSVEVPDPYTVRVTLKQPFAPFLSKLTFGAGFVLNPRAVQSLGDNLQRDLTGAGSGAFRLASWQKDVAITLERNPTYWKKDADGGALPYLDRIVLKSFPDENVRLTNVRTGDADAMIGNPPYKDIADLSKDPNLTVHEALGQGLGLLFLNSQTEPFNNAAVRRALSYAIDRAQIRKTVYFDYGKVLDTPIPEALPWAHVKDGPYLRRDVAKARQELQSAGKSSVTFTLQTSNASPELQQEAELIKDQIKEVGFNMEIQLLEFATVVANGGSGAFQALRLGWSGDVDPDTMYSLLATGAGFNFGRYSNPQFDKLLNDGRATPDQSKRATAYHDAQKLLYQEQPMVVFFNPPQFATMRKSTQGYPNNYNGYWGSRDFDKMWKRT
jgi:peptide/nickel transport system substrate-binding protein